MIQSGRSSSAEATTDKTPPTVNDPAFWAAHYRAGSDRWDLGGPTPSLVEYLARSAPPRGRVAVPGCGRGHDIRVLARLGYEVHGFDFAPDAVSAARNLAAREGLTVTIGERDVFGLGADHAAAFDGVWEYTSFCAVDPTRRPDYVEVVATILKPGGWLLACFFPVRDVVAAVGPPFSATRAEIERLFAPHFAFEETRVPATSADGRAVLEWLVRARRR
jgi:SAM-dependent methyltransferase